MFEREAAKIIMNIMATLFLESYSKERISIGITINPPPMPAD